MEHDISEIKGEFEFDVIPCHNYQGNGTHQQMFDFKLYPQVASDIWKAELSPDRVLKSKLEAEVF